MASIRFFLLALPLLALTACPMAPARTPPTMAEKVTDCHDWSDPHMANYRNNPLGNHGCAHAVNHRRMLADENDLNGGITDHRPDMERSMGVIETYRTPVAPAETSEPLIEGE